MSSLSARAFALALLLAFAALLPKLGLWRAGEPEYKGVEFYTGAFAPVPDLEGVLPLQSFSGVEGLRGVLLRNGPNPALSITSEYHWFDGDGFVHAVRFVTDGATYAAHQLHTPRMKAETTAGKPLWLRFGDVQGLWGLMTMLVYEAKLWLGLIPFLNELERGTANTAFAVHPPRGTVYATNEGSAPFGLALNEDGGLESKGYEYWNGSLQHGVTAHPKYDPRTGELLFFGYNVTSKDRDVSYSRVDATGRLVRSVSAKLRWKTMMHDWAVTETRGIFTHMPLVFDPRHLLTSDDGAVFQFDASKTAAFGVFPRDMEREEEIVWIDAGEPMFIMHTLSAWDVDEDRVLLTAVRMSRFDLNFTMGDPVLHSHLWQWQLNTQTRVVEWSRQIVERPGEFPVMNEAWRCRKHRWGYMALQGPLMFNGVVKVDLEKGVEMAHVAWPAEVEAGEFVFASRDGAVEEDDGYLVGIVTNVTSMKSFVRVIDARTFAGTPVADTELPRRVPHGFHAQWVPAG